MNFSNFKYIVCLLIGFLILTKVQAQSNNQPVTVSGKVVDLNNKPLAGVAILIQEKKSSNVTEADGTFSFETSPNDQIIFQKTVFYC